MRYERVVAVRRLPRHRLRAGLGPRDVQRVQRARPRALPARHPADRRRAHLLALPRHRARRDRTRASAAAGAALVTNDEHDRGHDPAGRRARRHALGHRRGQSTARRPAGGRSRAHDPGAPAPVLPARRRRRRLQRPDHVHAGRARRARSRSRRSTARASSASRRARSRDTMLRIKGKGIPRRVGIGRGDQRVEVTSRSRRSSPSGSASSSRSSRRSSARTCSRRRKTLHGEAARSLRVSGRRRDRCARAVRRVTRAATAARSGAHERAAGRPLYFAVTRGGACSSRGSWTSSSSQSGRRWSQGGGAGDGRGRAGARAHGRDGRCLRARAAARRAGLRRRRTSPGRARCAEALRVDVLRGESSRRRVRADPAQLGSRRVPRSAQARVRAAPAGRRRDPSPAARRARSRAARGWLDAPLLGVVTDYTAHACWAERASTPWRVPCGARAARAGASWVSASIA